MSEDMSRRSGGRRKTRDRTKHLLVCLGYSSEEMDKI